MDQLFVSFPSNLQLSPLPLASNNHPSWNTILEQDEYDGDPADLPTPAKKDDKQIRRRSSKACDQCRKSKCKCERPANKDHPCKNCILLGTPCTFLGPSRKRGPPKGYIDAIESRLHQTEALLGTLMTSDDSRVRSLIDDLSGDPLARHILERVDESPFASRGTRSTDLNHVEDRAARVLRTSVSSSPHLFPFASPSPEWQQHLRERLRIGTSRAAIHYADVHGNEPGDENSPRQRRRLDSSSPQHNPDSSTLSQSPSVSPIPSPQQEELSSTIGQLSLNEESQVRYHGHASGLHLLSQSERLDKRNEGGIWRFPKAGVWPRASKPSNRPRGDLERAEKAARAAFPSSELQKELLELYFVYVHPVLPMIQQAEFWRDFHGEPLPTERTSPSQGLAGPECRIPTLLLLSMFSVAARYRRTPEVFLPPSVGNMWSAGDEYLENAKRILNQTYASSRPSTCQALLLLGYREVGIGATANAWLYVGMAVRMAQDLGMHRSAENWHWQRRGAAELLFSPAERQVRQRIWYVCVLMDKYVSTHIGRPLSIFERDFDTPYPVEEQQEEMALWEPHPTPWPGDGGEGEGHRTSLYTPVPTHLISCFNASASLSSILSNIIETIYAIRHPALHTSRHVDASILEKNLDKWYLDLPPHLQLVLCGKTGIPPPNVWTLHMQYWCTVLLLHRPFIRSKVQGVQEEGVSGTDFSRRKAFDMCANAAAKISSIVSTYSENFVLQRSPAFLAYYVFSAGIMHVTTLSIHPTGIQARLGLQQCMDALRKLMVPWPSAGRAWELLHGSKIDMKEVELSGQARQRYEKRKREIDPSPSLPVVGLPATDASTDTSKLSPTVPVLENWDTEFGFSDDLLLGDSYSYHASFLWKDLAPQVGYGPVELVGSSLYGLPLLPESANGEDTQSGGAPQPFMGN